MMENKNDKAALFDARPFGHAVKEARQCRNLTRNAVAEQLNISPRYLMSIENNGQHSSVQVFYSLATMFNISADRFFFVENNPEKCYRYQQLDRLMHLLSENDLDIVEGTIKGILKSKRIDD